MIAAVPYTFTGFESLLGSTVLVTTRVDGDDDTRVDGEGEDRVTGESVIATPGPLVYIHPMGGHRCLDVIFNGVSLEIGVECEVNENTGGVQLFQDTDRGDELLVLFITKPWFLPGEGGGGEGMLEYEPDDYEEDDYE